MYVFEDVWIKRDFYVYKIYRNVIPFASQISLLLYIVLFPKRLSPIWR